MVATRARLAAWVALAMMAAGNVQGGIVTFDLKDGTRDTGWRISYDDQQVFGVGFTGNATGNNKGTLQIDKVFKNTLGPIDIKFMEIAPAAADSFGLRITLNENVHNQSGSNWTGFNMQLVDTNALSDQATSGHPGFAHFHPDSGGYLAPPFSLVGSDPANPTGNKAKSLTFGNGLFVDSSARAFQYFGIHQYEDMGVKRDFILREAALVPEPATFASLALGGSAALLIARRRRRDHATA